VSATFPTLRLVEETRDWSDGQKGLVVNRMWLDGKEYHMPIDEDVTITATPEGLVKANLTVFVSRVVIEETTKLGGR
jgi:hypothetical protein